MIVLVPITIQACLIQHRLRKMYFKRTETRAARNRVVDFIVADHALSLSHSQRTLVRLNGQKHWRLLGGFRYLAALVMGWRKFSQWLETCLLMCFLILVVFLVSTWE